MAVLSYPVDAENIHGDIGVESQTYWEYQPQGLVKYTYGFSVTICGSPGKLHCTLDGVDVSSNMRIAYGDPCTYAEFRADYPLNNGVYRVFCDNGFYGVPHVFEVDYQEPLWNSCLYDGEKFVADIYEANPDYAQIQVEGEGWGDMVCDGTICTLDKDVEAGKMYRCRAMDKLGTGSYYSWQTVPLIISMDFQKGWNMFSWVIA